MILIYLSLQATLIYNIKDSVFKQLIPESKAQLSCGALQMTASGSSISFDSPLMDNQMVTVRVTNQYFDQFVESVRMTTSSVVRNVSVHPHYSLLLRTNFTAKLGATVYGAKIILQRQIENGSVIFLTKSQIQTALNITVIDPLSVFQPVERQLPLQSGTTLSIPLVRGFGVVVMVRSRATQLPVSNAAITLVIQHHTYNSTTSAAGTALLILVNAARLPMRITVQAANYSQSTFNLTAGRFGARADVWLDEIITVEIRTVLNDKNYSTKLNITVGQRVLGLAPTDENGIYLLRSQKSITLTLNQTITITGSIENVRTKQFNKQFVVITPSSKVEIKLEDSEFAVVNVNISQQKCVKSGVELFVNGASIKNESTDNCKASLDVAWSEIQDQMEVCVVADGYKSVRRAFDFKNNTLLQIQMDPGPKHSRLFFSVKDDAFKKPVAQVIARLQLTSQSKQESSDRSGIIAFTITDDPPEFMVLEINDERFEPIRIEVPKNESKTTQIKLKPFKSVQISFFDTQIGDVSGLACNLYCTDEFMSNSTSDAGKVQFFIPSIYIDMKKFEFQLNVTDPQLRYQDFVIDINLENENKLEIKQNIRPQFMLQVTVTGGINSPVRNATVTVTIPGKFLEDQTNSQGLVMFAMGDLIKPNSYIEIKVADENDIFEEYYEKVQVQSSYLLKRDIELKSHVQIFAQIMDNTSKSVSGAEISFYNKSGWIISRQSDSNGRVHFTSLSTKIIVGETIYIKMQNHDIYKSISQEIFLISPITTVTIVLEQQRKFRLSFIVAECPIDTKVMLLDSINQKARVTTADKKCNATFGILEESPSFVQGHEYRYMVSANGFDDNIGKFIFYDGLDHYTTILERISMWIMIGATVALTAVILLIMATIVFVTRRVKQPTYDQSQALLDDEAK